MKIIVAGSRSFTDYNILHSYLYHLFALLPTVSIVSGTARGADQLGERFAEQYNLHVDKFPANWDKYGKAAGYICNKEMDDFADGLVAFWDGQSMGTKQMIQYMNSLNKQYRIINF